MIKNTFWKNFKLKTEKNYCPDKADKNILNVVKPLSLKGINKLPNKKLQIFIDDIISNKKINNLLFLSSAKKELSLYFKQKNAVLKNFNLLKSYNIIKPKKKITDCEELFLKKKNDMVFKTIKQELINYKNEKEKEDEKYKIKYNNLLKSRNRNKDTIDTLAVKLFFKPVNDVRYSSYQRSLKYCLEKCKSEPNFKLPDVSLDINDAFSRLYHNMILSPIKYKFPKKNNSKKIPTKKSLILKNIGNLNTIKSFSSKKLIKKKSIITENYPGENIKKQKKFNLKNYFKEFKGKEYLITPSFSTRNICWKKNSGGPNIKLEPKGKINLNKFKRNQTFEKYNYNSDKILNNKNDDDIIDVNDYRDENKESNLHLAIKNNNEKLVKYFIDKNYSPNEQNIDGDTPLHLAIKLKNINIINLLLDDGGNVNIKNNKGLTPYDIADREIKAKINMNLKIEN